VRTDRVTLLTATVRAAAVLDAKRHTGGHVVVTVTGEAAFRHLVVPIRAHHN
jgi:hypothetical protein